MKALIDGDILVYRVGYTTQDVELPLAKWRMDESINLMLAELDVESYVVYLTSTDKSNYRFGLYELYKANRKSEKPLWYNELRQHLTDAHEAIMVFEQEADDALAIAQRADTVICSIDKDLDQIAGMHYNFVKKQLYQVTPEEGLKFFYYQLLKGDAADNIPGCAGIGDKKATRILEGCLTEDEMYEATREQYLKAYGEEAGDTYLLIFARCLKIRETSDEDLWQPPNKRNLSIEVDSNEVLQGPSSLQE